jgi:hypothetical protein
VPAPRRYRPGQRQLSAQQLNDQQDTVQALAGMQVTGNASFQKEGGVFTLNVGADEGGFWARIDAEGIFDKGGLYAWTEMDLQPNGTYDVLSDGRTGTVGPEIRDPAREWAGKRAVPVGLVVWMIPGTAAPSSVPYQIDSGYTFVCPDLLQLVRITDDPRNADGDYTGYVQRYDPTTNSWADSELIWVRNAN